MELDNRELDKSYLRAKKRVEKLKKYSPKCDKKDNFDYLKSYGKIF